MDLRESFDEILPDELLENRNKKSEAISLGSNESLSVCSGN
jgi:hypothetical protein